MPSVQTTTMITNVKQFQAQVPARCVSFLSTNVSSTSDLSEHLDLIGNGNNNKINDNNDKNTRKNDNDDNDNNPKMDENNNSSNNKNIKTSEHENDSHHSSTSVGIRKQVTMFQLQNINSKMLQKQIQISMLGGYFDLNDNHSHFIDNFNNIHYRYHGRSTCNLLEESILSDVLHETCDATTYTELGEGGEHIATITQRLTFNLRHVIQVEVFSKFYGTSTDTLEPSASDRQAMKHVEKWCRNERSHKHQDKDKEVMDVSRTGVIGQYASARENEEQRNN